MSRSKRWHPSQESDELIFAVCDRFLAQIGVQYDPRSGESSSSKRGAAAAVADWLQDELGRKDLSREKIYPLFWEATRRNFLTLTPPQEKYLAGRLAEKYGAPRGPDDDEPILVVNARGAEAPRHVTAVGSDLIFSLIKRVAEKKKRVHIGLGGGHTAMLVAKQLAHRVATDLDCPELVLHTLSAGGFEIDQPHKAPITYFSYFDDALTKVECVALFSQTVVSTDDYEQVRKSPGVHKSFERADEIDIVVTSFASAYDEHGMLGQFLEHLIRDGELDPKTVRRMEEAGWVGDVQFRPYSAQGPMLEDSPVRAVTLFELSELVERAQSKDRYVVLLAGPCGECGRLKADALRPLLTQPSLRVWTHLVTDAETATALLR